MDLLDRLLGHDAWTTRQLLRLCEPLTDGELDREFDIGHRSVRATLAHLIWNMEVWSGLMAGTFQLLEARKIAEGSSIPDLTARLDRAAANLSRMARSVRQRNGWDEEWVDVLDDPPTRKTYGGAIAHVITHSMHHRAQLLYLLRQLGIRDLPEGTSSAGSSRPVRCREFLGVVDSKRPSGESLLARIERSSVQRAASRPRAATGASGTRKRFPS